MHCPFPKEPWCACVEFRNSTALPFLWEGREELAISAMTRLTIEVDGARVTVSVFIQPDSSQACLIRMSWGHD